jgi:hypothetical protein
MAVLSDCKEITEPVAQDKHSIRSEVRKKQGEMYGKKNQGRPFDMAVSDYCQGNDLLWMCSLCHPAHSQQCEVEIEYPVKQAMQFSLVTDCSG